ncbi:uncharacterized protein LOC103457215 [Poecilia reticulata]|uniref:uncharacterized protein LOC103457215 n=1 Tax=Poecilia reticulata TaxID=8081 RepID=UPI0007E966BF|nr:PREDICTED: uncharacterized protein LOC103457215 [Poecilia reticulata]
MYLQLVLMLTATAAAGKQPSQFLVRVGDEVTLPCKDVTDGQNKCDRTTWIFRSVSTVTLFEAGNINLNISDRLNVPVNCSLVIKKVSMEDFGQYICRQSTSGQQEPNSSVHLSVVHLTEQKINDSVVLNCSVVDYNFHRHTVEWLHEGEGETSSDSKPSPPVYRSTVILTTSFHQNSTFFSSIKCNVTNISTREVQLFTFSHQSTDQKTDQKIDHNTGWTWWHIVVPVASAVILIIILVFIKWKKTKGSEIKKEENVQEPILQPEVTVLEPETSEAVVEPEGGVYYASVCYAKKAKGKAQVHSSVENSPPEDPAAQEAVYAVVKKTETADVTE